VPSRRAVLGTPQPNADAMNDVDSSARVASREMIG
jgi:hypothetical protein